MIYIAFTLSLIFFSVGFLVTHNNAKYLLSGYNTMPAEKRSEFDIKGYVAFFRRFHIILGISLFGGTMLISLIDKNWASRFMTGYPLAAYIYFIVAGTKFSADQGQRLTSYVVGGLLLVPLLFITLNSGFETSEMILTDRVLEIKGTFGVTLTKKEILGQKLVEKLPEQDGIFSKVGGFAAGDYAKGNFRIKGGRIVKLYVNKTVSPIILLNTSRGDVYYNADETDMTALFEKIRHWRQH